jgi:hypothetical protein
MPANERVMSMTIRSDRLILLIVFIALLLNMGALSRVIGGCLNAASSVVESTGEVVHPDQPSDQYRLAVLCVILITVVAIIKLMRPRTGPPGSDATGSYKNGGP